jgi:hypothetical protein
MCWDAVSRLQMSNEIIWLTNYHRLAYCELYVSLGTLFRRFPAMKSNVLTPADLVYDDYFSGYHPQGSTKFHVTGSV